MSILISHSHADGTLLIGSVKGDGVWEIAKQHGWAYSRNVGIFIRGSRDRVAKRYVINSTAEALRQAGHDVTTEIDDTFRSRADVLATQDERLEGRAAALAAKAERKAAETESTWAASDRLVADIPLGQPILVGHHSEGGHRRRLERSQNLAFKAVELGREARMVEQRAEAVGKAAAYSATPKVTARRIERLEAEQRDIERKLNGYTRNFRNGRNEIDYVERHDVASGAFREQLLARQAQLEDQLAYDRAALANAIADGRHTQWGPHNIHIGDRIQWAGYQYLPVVRVNKVTVSLQTEYSWTQKLRYTEIHSVKCDHDAAGGQS